MDDEQAALEWATEEFGHCQLGNALRSRRLVAMAARLAQAPGGLVTEVFDVGHERVGAYRFLENDRIKPGAILASCAQATLRRANGDEWLYVPIDGSSLTLADPSGRRHLGAVGTYQRKGRGLKTMSSIGVRQNGSSVGLLDLQYWVRQEVPGRKRTRDQRTVDQKETNFWLQAMARVETVFAQSSSQVRPWFQVDREGDFHDLLKYMAQMTDSRATVRAAHNRRMATGEFGTLWDTLRAQAPGGTYELTVREGPQRQARTAQMVVRWAPVQLQLRDRSSGSKDGIPVTLWAVLALETDTVPPGEQPLQWLLLTNAPVSDLQTAVEVLFGYAQRWRVEEYHRAWKTQCRVEQSQLQDGDHLQIWATLLAAVAMRIERIKYLARTEPDTPATVEFSREEIDAVILLRRPSGYRRGASPNIGQLVRWIADLGGYIGPSNGPPGATVIGRGLQRIEPVILAVRSLDEEKPD